MQCPNCAAMLSEDANFCQNCGTNVIPFKTGTYPYAAAGAVDQAADAASAAQEPTPFEKGYQQGYEWATGNSGQAYEQAQQNTGWQAPPANPYAQYGQPVPLGAKNHIAAGLLAIFLGSLGIHKFYLGYTKEGVIMLLVSLLTFGIGLFVMEVIAIIEGVLYLVKTDSEFYYTYELGHKPWF